jgi:hypothetical protein
MPFKMRKPVTAVNRAGALGGQVRIFHDGNLTESQQGANPF